MRPRDRRESSLPYTPKPLEKLTVGVQRVVVVYPVEQQEAVGGGRDGVTGQVRDDGSLGVGS